MYTIRESARLLQQSEAKLRRWLFASGETQVLRGLRDGNACMLDFPLLVEAMVVGQLREAGFSMQQIRRARTNLAGLSQSGHPFAHQMLRTDCAAKRLYWLERSNLTDLNSQQMAFLKVIEPYLSALEFDPATGLATRWMIGDGVVVDSKFGYGAPVIVGTRASSDLVAAMYHRTGDLGATAEWFTIQPAQVLAAVGLAERLSTRAQSPSAGPMAA